MIILFHSHASEIGGAERSLLAMMHLAREEMHEVLLCAPAGPLSDRAREGGFVLFPTEPLLLSYTRNPLTLARYVLGAVGPLRAFMRAIRGTQPDVVHANSFRSGLLAATALYLLRSPPRLIVHVRDVLGADPRIRLVARVIDRRADTVVAISDSVARSFGTNRLHVRMVHNAIDPRAFIHCAECAAALRTQLQIPATSPLLAIAGQLTPWKGHQDALEAFAAVRKERPEAHLVIAGAAKFTGAHRRYDTSAYERVLRARATRPDLAGHVHFTGELEDIVALYSAADLLLVPSWAEPFGRVVIEAMAAGCPVLATRAGGIPEIITHGVDGWLVPPRNPAALAQAALHLLGEPQLRSTLAHAAHRTVEERFSLEGYMERLERIWHKGICQKRG